MKIYMIALFIGLLGTSIQAQDKKAEIKFETDVIDYGDIANGSDGLREFKFKNTGDAPLIISKAYSTCGCTVPTPPKEPILPGENGVIQVKYNTKLPGGPIRKTITVYTNASAEPYTLKIKGTLLPEKGALEKEKSGASN